MRPPRYPREALVSLRDTKKDAQAVQLREAVAHERVRSEALVQAQHAVATHEQATADVLSAEAERLAADGLRAADLQQLGAYQVAASQTHAQLLRVRAEEQQALSHSQRLTTEQRAALAVAHGEHDAALRDRIRWEEAEQKRVNAKEEEEMEDAFLGSRASREEPK